MDNVQVTVYTLLLLFSGNFFLSSTTNRSFITSRDREKNSNRELNVTASDGRTKKSKKIGKRTIDAAFLTGFTVPLTVRMITIRSIVTLYTPRDTFRLNAILHQVETCKKNSSINTPI